MHHAYIGLGANLGEAAATLRAALAALAALPDTRLIQASSLFKSAPIGMAEQPDYLNAVAHLGTPRSAHTLLHDLLAIEARFGRQRSTRNAPRTLDLDLLLYDDLACHGPSLTLPHPRLHERAFVLHPLAEITPPGFLIPGHGSLAQLLPGCAGQRIEKLAAAA